ncbi:unnamed protein product [Amoebophrya sp. A120]|nr:unnamed protein product [Amoebophrya sp. A120]|eukprot:GSA120T00017057001.1
MGILFSAFSGGRRKDIQLPEVSALHLELLSLYASTVTEMMGLLLPLPLTIPQAAGANSKNSPNEDTDSSTSASESGGNKGGIKTSTNTTIQQAQKQIIPVGKAVKQIGERTLKRSEVTNDSEVYRFFHRTNRPHLIFVCHKIQGQRTPLLDSKGLYTKFLDAALNVCEVVFLLSAVPSVEYFHRLLSEQPTLNWLFQRRRIIPIFESSNKPETTADGKVADAKNSSSGTSTSQQRYWEPLMADALQGKLPSLGSFQSDLKVEFAAGTPQEIFVDKFLLLLSDAEKKHSGGGEGDTVT